MSKCKLFPSISTALLIFLIAFLSAVAVAQSTDADSEDENSSPSSQMDDDNTATPNRSTANNPSPDTQDVSPERIVDFLKNRPDLVQRMRNDYIRENPEALQQLKDNPEGESAISAFKNGNLDQVSDQAIAQLRNDDQFRNWVVQWLTNNGYELPPERKELSSGSRQTNDKSERTQPAAKSRKPDQKPDVKATANASPYGDLPSLKDLYAQVPAPDKDLKRFGSDVFRAGNVNGASIDVPAGPDYVLGPGDGLNLDIWGGITQHLSLTVDREGRVILPEAGSLVVSGLRLGDAQQKIQRLLEPQYRNAKVDVSLTRVRTVRIYVVGDVEHPGAYDVTSLSTILNALYSAGGPTQRGSLRRVQHFRGKELVGTVDLYDMLLHGVRNDVERLQPGDTVLIPPIGPEVTVAGMVRRPAIYELLGETQLNDVINLAGGLMVSATLHQVSVDRIVAHSERMMVNLQLPDKATDEVIRQTLSSFKIQDGDRIRIAPILPYSNQTVYLEGHVARPGKFPFHDGMQIDELVKSYKDLLPEAASRAEIVRLEPPDFHPVTMEFNLDEVLDATDPIELKPFDTVRIYGRYESDAPKVGVQGEVLRPGQYPLTKGMTATELIRTAGGFKRSAFKQEAELGSYVVQNGEKILLERKTLEIGKAFNGDHSADAELKPGDQLIVRNLSGWSEIGASVTLKGEVVYPGKYAIQDGERLSSVIKRAGGFKPESYPQGAILSRLEVQQFERRNREELVHRIEAASAGENFANASAQQRQMITNLRNLPAPGRVVIRISPDISAWENTPDDISLRSGDSLSVPKRPGYVVVTGQVFNSSAITYAPGKNAGWYLKQAGGPNEFADKKAMFIVAANGSVIGQSGSGLFRGDVLSTKLHPGDSIVVPEKIVSGGKGWKELLNAAQVVSSIAITARVASSF